MGEVNISNLNVLFNIPVRSKAGAIPFSYPLFENNSFQPPVPGQTFYLYLMPRFMPASIVDRGLGKTTGKVKTCRSAPAAE